LLVCEVLLRSLIKQLILHLADFTPSHSQIPDKFIWSESKKSFCDQLRSGFGSALDVISEVWISEALSIVGEA
jgi:hypothetical protein